MSPARVTLLTDFGTRDGFVGAVKAAIASALPGAVIDDVAHDIPAGDVAAGARALERYWRRYPEKTVHVVVVDPGVGTARAALACAADGRFLIGPDNGVLTPAVSLSDARCVSIDMTALRGPVSPTFHGRDVFAPAAAVLAGGGRLEDLGPELAEPQRLDRPQPRRVGQDALGEIVAVDAFGNATTNLPGAWVGESSRVVVAGLRLAVQRTYGDVGRGEPIALVDSEGRLEVAVRDGSAVERLQLRIGTAVRLLALA